MTPSKSYTDLEVYKKCRAFRIRVSQLVKTFPDHEKYQLSSQLIRASRSITACIAEGYGRFYYKDGIRFCRMARGSLIECTEHLVTAYDEQYISHTTLIEYKESIDECVRLLNGYIRYIYKQKPAKEEDT